MKFVNRFLANEIFDRRYRLKNFRNKLGGKFSIERNLTRKRKQLLETAETQLTTYKFKWTKNGDIYVKKHAKSKRIKIASQKMLDKLIADQNEDTPIKSLATVPPPMQTGVPPPASSNEEAPTSTPENYMSSSNFPHLPIPSPSLIPSQRFPPPGNVHTPPLLNIPSAYSFVCAANYAENSYLPYTPFEQRQLDLGNRNSLLSPREQMTYTRRQPLNGIFKSSRSYSR